MLSWTKSEGVQGMTLLHLAAVLGYTRLVATLLTWRSENPNVVLETEIDALSQDSEGFTPLVIDFKPISHFQLKFTFVLLLFQDVVMR